MNDQEPPPDSMPTRMVPQTEHWTGEEPSMFDGRMPKQVGEYELIRLIGGGGMGVVFEARHVRLKRSVALKLLPSRHLSDSVASRRFFREMEAAGKLAHPHIVSATDAGVADGVPYLVMELVRGLDLARVVSRYGPLPPLAAFQAIEQVTSALSYIHGLGMVHRDVKPSNLLFNEQGIVKVTDLGLIHSLDALSDSDDITATGDVIGTIDYMAPEQAQNPKLADHRADIYSLGCCLHYLLSGAPVYDAESRVDRLIAHRSAELPDLSRRCTVALPHSANELFQEMLAKNPPQRSQSVDDVRKSLHEICDEIRASPPRSSWKSKFGGKSLPAGAGLPEVAQILYVDRPPAADTQAEQVTVIHPRRRPNRSRRPLKIAAGLILSLLAAYAVYEMAWVPRQQPRALLQSDLVEEEDPDQPPAAVAPTILRGHVGAVFNVHFTGDGQHLLSCGSDGTVRVWDLPSKRQQGILTHERGPQGPHVIDVVPIPDTPLAVSVCYSGIATVWDWQQRELRHSFTGHRNRVEGVACLGGTRVLTTGMDDAMYIWDVEDAHLISQVANDHQGGVRAIAVDSTGHRALTGDYEGNLFRWDLDDGDAPRAKRISITDEPVSLWCADWVSDTDLVAIGGVYLSGESLLLAYDVAQDEVVREFTGHQGRVKGVCVSRDGTRLYSAGENVRGWMIDTADEILEINDHSDEVFAVDVSADGTKLASGGTDGTIRIFTLSEQPTERP